MADKKEQQKLMLSPEARNKLSVLAVTEGVNMSTVVETLILEAHVK